MTAVLAAVLLWWPQPGRLSRLAITAPTAEKHPRTTRQALLLAAIVPIVVAAALGGLRAASLTLLVVLVSGTTITLVSRYRKRRDRRLRAEQVADGCATLASEIRAGRPAVAALAVVAEDHRCFVPVAAAVSVGGSPAEILRHGAQLPGQEGLVEVARAWEVSQRTGSPLAPVLDVVAAGLRGAQRLARARETELAASRATGQLLGVLPVVGIVLGFILGGNPIAFLLESQFGPLILTTGVGLTCAGLLWSDQLGAA